MEPTTERPASTVWWKNTVTWKTRDGHVIPLEELTPAHRENIIAMISGRSTVRRLRSMLGYLAVFELLGSGVDPYGDDHTEADLFDSYSDWLDSATDTEIVDSLPLVQRLRELNLPTSAAVRA